MKLSSRRKVYLSEPNMQDTLMNIASCKADKLYGTCKWKLRGLQKLCLRLHCYEIRRLRRVEPSYSKRLCARPSRSRSYGLEKELQSSPAHLGGEVTCWHCLLPQSEPPAAWVTGNRMQAWYNSRFRDFWLQECPKSLSPAKFVFNIHLFKRSIHRHRPDQNNSSFGSP